MANQVPTLENPQELEAVVSGPDGANRLFVCTGVAPINQYSAGGAQTQVWTWRVGPQLARLQFRRAVAQGALVRVTGSGQWSLAGLDTDWDDESGRVEVRAEVFLQASGGATNPASVGVQGISYHVTILAAMEA